jgi:putative membrane protein
MLVRWLLAAIHLLAFGFALASILRRAWALRQLGAASAACASIASTALPAAFRADSGWGLSALVLVVTGLMRAFGGFEKGADYYLHEPLFHVKMTALALILILEVPPMIALIRWRIALKKGATPDLRRAPTFARISVIQTLLLIVMVFAASGMARGIGLPDGAV